MGKPESSESSKDLLHLENNLAHSSLEGRFIICNVKDTSSVKAGGIESKRGRTQPITQCSVLERVKSFLPAMDKANRKLNAEAQENGSEKFNIEILNEEESVPYIEMDLALGVTDLRTAEAVAAAELAVNGQVLSRLSSSSSEDTDKSNDESNSRGDDGSCINGQEDEVDWEISTPSRRRKKRPKIEQL